ncbi:MAG: HlyD family efflux transporter periplasmic adaptor subunit [Angelakisella sp.]
MKKIILCILSAVLILSVGMLPERIIGSVTRYSVIKPTQEQYQPQLICNGYVMAKEGVQMVVSDNVVVKELAAVNGSWVTAGQVIAITDTPDISETFLSQSLDAPKTRINSSELEALAAQYGMEVPTDSSKAPAILERITTKTPTPKIAKAPISGIITWNDVSEGRFIPAGSLFCTILGLDSYKAIVQIPADEASSIFIGAEAIISGNEINNQKYAGVVTSVGNSVSRGVTTGGYNAVIDVEILVTAPIDSMRHGAGITCVIQTGKKETILTLPYEAIHQDEANNEYVYLAVNNVLKKRYIQTGIELEDTIQVTKGIGAGDIVADVPADKLQKRYALELSSKKG